MKIDIRPYGRVHGGIEEYFILCGIDLSSRQFYYICREILSKANSMFPEKCNYSLDFEVPSVFITDKDLDYGWKGKKITDLSVHYGRSKWGTNPNMLINLSSNVGSVAQLSLGDEDIILLAEEINSFLSSRNKVERKYGFALTDKADQFTTAFDIWLAYNEIYAKVNKISVNEIPTSGQILHYLIWADTERFTDFFSICEELHHIIQEDGTESLTDIDITTFQVCLLSEGDRELLRMSYPKNW